MLDRSADNAPDAVLDIAVTAARLQELCVRQGWRFCFIGGIAVQAWSEPRVTDDVDLTVITGFGGEDDVIDVFLQQDWLLPRREDARSFANRHRILLLKTAQGVGVDIAMGAFPFEELAAERARMHELTPGALLRLCTPEDLIVFKTFAARPRDWRDIEMTIVRQGDDALDWNYIVEQLTPLLALKEQPELLQQLMQLRESAKKR